MTGQGDKDLCLFVSFGVLAHVWMLEHAKNTKENQQWRSNFFAERHYIIGIRQSSLRGEKISVALYVGSVWSTFTFLWSLICVTCSTFTQASFPRH